MTGQIDVTGDDVTLRALTWSDWDNADAPVAVCLHGFPDTAHGWGKVLGRGPFGVIDCGEQTGKVAGFGQGATGDSHGSLGERKFRLETFSTQHMKAVSGRPVYAHVQSVTCPLVP